MNKKGQAESIIIFFGLAIAILVVSVIVLRVANSVITPFQAQIGNMSVTAGTAVNDVHTSFAKWWDYLIIGMFFLNIIILLVSAFMVDIHPAFVIVYIFAIIFMFVFGNYALLTLDSIWNMVGTSTEQAQTPLEQFLINNFQLVMLGVVILSGIVMYSKFKYFSGQGAGGSY
jgi:hypothetical protein